MVLSGAAGRCPAIVRSVPAETTPRGFEREVSTLPDGRRLTVYATRRPRQSPPPPQVPKR